jgi:hypothetical protein
MSELETILLNFFMKRRDGLNEVYCWEIPTDVPFGFKRGTDSCARANIRLRRFLHKMWLDKPSLHLQIAKWYVSVWGGIRSNQERTIKRYVRLRELDLAASQSPGIASWSKILALRNPDKYPIYDARVSAALSALQFANGVKNPILFPRASGRNTVIESFQKWQSTLSWHRPRHTYADYVSLLTSVAEKSGLSSPEELEMLLFADAPTLVTKILKPSTLTGDPVDCGLMPR